LTFIDPLLKALDDQHHRQWKFVGSVHLHTWRYFERMGWVEIRPPQGPNPDWGVRLTPAGRSYVRQPRVDGRRAHLGPYR